MTQPVGIRTPPHVHHHREVGLPGGQRTVPADPDPTELARWGRHAPAFGLEVLGPALDTLAS